MQLQMICKEIFYTAFAYRVYRICFIQTGMCAVEHTITKLNLFSRLGIGFLWQFLCLQSLTLGGKAADTWDSKHPVITAIFNSLPQPKLTQKGG